ncbi:MAG TPA: hypothetical protein VGR69_10895 [Candidatus Rubrimentiphilum sp.]|nr:hypothetical protein [Candidatus Rubrimentiphilum sp.]
MMRITCALFALLLIAALLFQTHASAQTTTTTNLPGGGTQTVTTYPEGTSHNSDGTDTVVTREDVETKDNGGNVTKRVRKVHKKTTRGKKAVSESGVTEATSYGSLGESTVITDGGSSTEGGDADDTHTEITKDPDGTITKGYRKRTYRPKGGKPQITEEDYVPGQGWRERTKKEGALRQVIPKPGNISATETAYAPDVAGPGSTIVATFSDAQTAGPSGHALVAFEDSKGHRTFFQALTDAQHRVAFKVAEGVVAVWLFKDFDARANPDAHAVKTIISRDAIVNGTQPVANIARAGPAIERAATAYERGGASGGIFSMQTRGVDPLNAQVLVDGHALGADTLAASDRSIKARFADNEPLGRHSISVASGTKRSNSVKADLVTLRADPLPPSETGSVQTLRVHVDGLPRTDRGTMYFHIAGSARLESGGENTSVPMTNGIAEVRIRGEHAGPALVNFTLHALLDVAEGGGYVSTGHTKTRETPPPGQRYTPPPTPTPTPLTPGDIGKPVIYGHDDYSCQTRVLDAWMEPTQGVWQDDVIFPDQDGKQYVRDKDSSRILYHAELPLIQNRDTVLSGVTHYLKNGTPTYINDRNHIVFNLRTNCTRNLKVHFHFIAVQTTSVAEWDDSTKMNAPLAGAPSQKPRIVRIAIDAEKGVPRGKPFQFVQNYTRYQITAKVLDEHDIPTGLKMDVDGDVVPAYGFSVHFVPVILSREDNSPITEDLLSRLAQRGAEDANWIGDYYPIPAKAIYGVLEDPVIIVSKNVPGKAAGSRDQALLDGINDRLSVQTMLENGGRVVAVMTIRQFHKDFAEPKTAAYTALTKFQNNGGKAFNNKFIVEPDNYTDTVTTAHEVAHTLVPGWMKVTQNQVMPAMESQCKTAQYHDNFKDWAYGLQLNFRGSDWRLPMRARTPIMSGVTALPWIAQCTYWLLTDVLRNVVPDPPLILVRGSLSRSGTRIHGTLGPEYDLRGVPSLTAHGPGQYTIALKNASGAVMATYGFDAIWRPVDSEIERNTFPFAFTVPAHSGVRTVEVDGPNGALATFLRSDVAPFAQIRSLIRSGKTATIEWNAPATSLSTVLYAANRKDYIGKAFETQTRRLIFKVAGRGGLVKLIVAKDGRSTETVRILP